MKINPIYKKIIPYIVVIIIAGVAGFLFTGTVYPENPNLKSYFDKICEMPFTETYFPSPETFWVLGGDCDDRAHVFKNYLISIGAKDVQICWMNKIIDGKMVQVSNGDWGHQFILWNGRVYNPSHNPDSRFYNAALSEYLEYVKKKYEYNVLYYENSSQVTNF